jgi:hypothetical protein
MTKRLIIAAFAVFMIAFGLAGQAPRVAVLDAIVARTIDNSVVIPVTEKVMEQFVNSGKYIVVDRANIEQVLSEKAFQLSELVSDKEATTIGDLVKADYVVILKVERVAETYFLSGKMISVKGGIIESQTSEEGEGKLSVLLRLAENVGRKLAGLKIAEASPSPSAAPKPSVEPKPSPTPRPVEPKPGPEASGKAYGDFSGLQVAMGIPSFSDKVGPFDQESSFDVSTRLFAKLGSDWYLAVNVSYLTAKFTLYSSYYSSTYYENRFEQFEISAGGGYALPVGPFQLYGGARLGFLSYSEDIESGYFLTYEGEAGTLTLSVEAGLDVRFSDSFALGARVDFSAFVVEDDYSGTSNTISAFRPMVSGTWVF